MVKSYTWLEPEYMPVPFKRYGIVEGITAGQFWGSADQVTVIYRRNSSFHVQELAVAWDPAGDKVLVGTDQRTGMPVKVNGKNARYHDGTWAPGPGPEQVNTSAGPVHWDRTREHSVTMRTGNGTFAVRCPRDAVPSPEELVRILSSLAG